MKKWLEKRSKNIIKIKIKNDRIICFKEKKKLK